MRRKAVSKDEGAQPDFEFNKVSYEGREPSNVLAFGYHFDLRVMTVAFKRMREARGLEGASVYHYFDCPLDFYKGLVAAESKGSYFQTSIKPCFKDTDTYTRRQYLSTGRLADVLKRALVFLTLPAPVVLKVPDEGEGGVERLRELVEQVEEGAALVMPRGGEIERLEISEGFRREIIEIIASLRYDSWKTVVERPRGRLEG